MNHFRNIRQVSLDDPHPNGTADKKDFDGHIAAFAEILTKLKAGKRVYLGIPEGERAGSIAYIKEVDRDLDSLEPPAPRYNSYSSGKTPWQCNAGFHCTLGWDKRRNKIKHYVGHGDVYLPDYDGPTVWKKFDKKAEEEKLLQTALILDRDGNELGIGDRVIYINARYGSAACLDRGNIHDIKINVQKGRRKQYETLHVLIRNDDGTDSDIRYPERSIIKLRTKI